MADPKLPLPPSRSTATSSASLVPQSPRAASVLSYVCSQPLERFQRRATAAAAVQPLTTAAMRVAGPSSAVPGQAATATIFPCPRRTSRAPRLRPLDTDAPPPLSRPVPATGACGWGSTLHPGPGCVHQRVRPTPLLPCSASLSMASTSSPDIDLAPVFLCSALSRGWGRGVGAGIEASPRVQV
jgi:hypothetical protein